MCIFCDACAAVVDVQIRGWSDNGIVKCIGRSAALSELNESSPGANLVRRTRGTVLLFQSKLWEVAGHSPRTW